MRWLRATLPLTLLVLFPATSLAQTPTLEELWQLVQSQQQQIESLEARLAGTEASASANRDAVRVTEERLSSTVDYVESIGTRDSAVRGWTDRTTLGGYGELHYNNLDADDAANDLERMDFHRFVLFVGHEFSDRVHFFSELELEHALAKDTDDGSSSGEVELEQAFLELDINDRHLARAGLFLVPAGLMNETHEPPTFYGVERNGVENVIIPATWWEGGLGLNGRYANGLSWDFAVHSGLAMPTTGGSAFRVRSGRQKVSNAAADHLAYTARGRFTGVRGLELAATVQFQTDPSQIGGDGLDDALLLSLHGAYQRGPFSLRALYARWNFDGAAVKAAGADEQSGWYLEPSYRVALRRGELGLYVRREDVEGARGQDQYQQWELGFNYWPVEDVVFKFDYRNREHDLAADAGRDFNGFDLGLGYQF